MSAQVLSVSLPSEIIYVSGTVNGTAYTWTLIEGAWTATVERAADDTYAVALAAVTAAGVSTNYALTLYYGLLSLITDRTRADVENETDKGFYNASDLNRVGAAVEYIAGRFAALGYDCPVTVKKDWLTSGAPTAAAVGDLSAEHRHAARTDRGHGVHARGPGEHGGAGLRQGQQHRADFARPRRAHRQHHKIMVLLRRGVRRRGLKGDNMQDRVSLYPGRVKLEPVAGQANLYDLTRADQPTQEGTPLNKANLLSDATAALMGLDAAATPDGAFAALAGKNDIRLIKLEKITTSQTWTAPKAKGQLFKVFAVGGGRGNGNSGGSGGGGGGCPHIITDDEGHRSKNAVIL